MKHFEFWILKVPNLLGTTVEIDGKVSLIEIIDTNYK